MQLNLADAEASAVFGRRLAGLLRRGDIIALHGDLGAGKTTLARAILTGLGYDGEVPSPSFAIVQYYDPPETRIPVLHADFYRLEDSEEVAELGLEESMDQRVTIAEWPDRAGDLMGGDNCLAIHIGFAPEGGRMVEAEPGTEWASRWSQI